MRHRLMLGLMLLGMFARALGAADQAPTKRAAAASQPSEDVTAMMRMIAGLGDDNYIIRQASCVALMGIKRSELENLRRAVMQSLPLEPSQISALREVVTQVYLSGEVFTPEEGSAGFLGISLANRNSEEDEGLLNIERGIAVVSRMPGFCAYRMLQSGDVILAMTSPVRLEFSAAEPERFSTAVNSIEAGQNVTFDVLRQGQIVSVTLTLNQRPSGISEVNKRLIFMGDRAIRAEEYWNKDFAPMLNELVG